MTLWVVDDDDFFQIVMESLYIKIYIICLLQNIIMPHQWLEGNLPVAAKCDVCEKTCGSVLRSVKDTLDFRTCLLVFFWIFDPSISFITSQIICDVQGLG